MFCSIISVDYGSYGQYLVEWEEAIKKGPGFPLHVLYYEDLKDVSSFQYSVFLTPFEFRVPVAHWVKRWPTDLENRGRSPLEALNRRRSSLAHSLSSSTSHRPDITEIHLERT